MAGWRVAILGPGGVGGLLGALLGRDGDDILCIARPGTADHLREHGLELHSEHFGDAHVEVEATTRLDRPVDVCLVTVKATQLEDALDALPADALGEALLIPFLNGVEHVDELRRRYPDAKVVGATIRCGSTRVAPGVIEHSTPFAVVEIGRAAGAFAKRLAEVGLDVTERDDEPAMMWAKLGMLAPMALLTTHEAAPLGDVRDRRGDELHAVVREVVAAARADGVELDEDSLWSTLQDAPHGFKSSMQHDAEAGRPIEIDAVGGAVLRAADRAGAQAPVTRRLVEDLSARYG